MTENTTQPVLIEPLDAIAAASDNGEKPQGKTNHNNIAILLIIALLIVLNIVVAHYYPPVAPHISVVPESILNKIVDGEPVAQPWFTIPLIGHVYLTNTMTSAFLVLILLGVLAFFVRRGTKSGDLRPTGFILVMEIIMDMLSGMVKNTIDPKWRDKIFPFYYTFFFYILITNVTKLIPFFENFGFALPVHGGFVAQKWTPWFYAITNELAPEGVQGYEVISFFRGASTSLNFTLSLAIGSVLMIQVFGVQAHGFNYFSKFIKFDYLILFARFLRGVFWMIVGKILLAVGKNGNSTFGSAWLAKIRAGSYQEDIETFQKKFGSFFIDAFVGLLELVSEIAKVLSFGFRLFGNMFAGSVLLLFLGYMVPVLLTTFLQLYELIFGVIQAFVFGMLTAIFMNMAVSHE